jgi:predicted GNAT superfamily acetyltransferase
MPSYTIQLLNQYAQMPHVEKLIDEIWGGGAADAIPAHLLITFAHNGGLVFGAYEGEQMVGLALGFPGLHETPQGVLVKHCSHQMGVHPEHRGKGIGFALKKAQWQMVRKQGIDLMTWTYDPLLSRNAYLNIGQLGAICQTYTREYYGEMVDALNAGLASDRFEVEWWLNTPRVEKRLDTTNYVRIRLDEYQKANAQQLYIPETDAASGLLKPPETYAMPEKKLLLMPIPSDFQTMRSGAPTLARDWRFFTRKVFETAFAASYIVTDFVYEKGKSYYVLTDGNAKIG